MRVTDTNARLDSSFFIYISFIFCFKITSVFENKFNLKFENVLQIIIYKINAKILKTE